MRNFNAADLSDHISTELYRHASFFFIYSCPLFFLKGWGRGPCEKVVHCYNSIPSTPTSQSFLAPNSSTLLFLCGRVCLFLDSFNAQLSVHFCLHRCVCCILVFKSVATS